MDPDYFFSKVNKNYLHIDFPLSKKEARLFYNELLDAKNILSHRFLPLIQFKIRFKKYPSNHKPVLKEREISLVSHHDSGIYSFLSSVINEKYNRYSKIHGISESSVAYRTINHLSNITVAKEVFDFIDMQSEVFVMKGDFKGFFDNLDHTILTKHIFEVLELHKDTLDYNVWLKIINNIENFRKIDRDIFTQTFENENLHIQNRHNVSAYFSSRKDFGRFIKKHKDLITTNKKNGIPQGTGISGILANVYMVEFDEIIEKYSSKYQGIYRRYSDDFIIVLPKKLLNYETFKIFVDYVINLSHNIVNLTIEENKTKMFSVSKGNVFDIKSNKNTSLDYLGFILQQNTIAIRPKSIYKFYYRGRRAIKYSTMASRLYSISKQRSRISNQKIKDLPLKIRSDYNKIYGGKNIFTENIHEQKAKNNRVERIIHHQRSKVGLPEIKKVKKSYLQKVDRAKPRESFLSYVKLANKIFSEGSFGYKLAFTKHAKKTRRKFYKLRRDLT